MVTGAGAGSAEARVLEALDGLRHGCVGIQLKRDQHLLVVSQRRTGRCQGAALACRPLLLDDVNRIAEEVRRNVRLVRPAGKEESACAMQGTAWRSTWGATRSS